MDAVFNIAGLFFMLSGMVAWLLAAFVFWFYWMCQRPQKEEENV
jgi:hypothetical protein